MVLVKNRHLVVVIVAALAIIASGCMKVNIKFDVADDGSAEVSGIVALDSESFQRWVDELGDEFGGDSLFPTSREALCQEFLNEAEIDSSADDRMSARPYDDGRFCGTEFSGRLSASEVADATGPLTGSEQITIRPDGDGWFFEMFIDEEVLGTSDLDGLEAFPGFADLFDDAEYIIRVRLPGKQVEHNGDFIESDGTVGWDIDLLNPPTKLMLRTEAGEPITGDADGGFNALGGGGDDGGSGWLVWLIVALALVALAVAAYFVLRNRNADGGNAAVAPGAGQFSNQSPSTPPQADAPPISATQPQPVTPATGSPTPEQATGAPVWDPARGAYVQWDPNANHWLVYNDTTSAWETEPG